MIGKIFTRFQKGHITSPAQISLHVDFILIEVTLEQLHIGGVKLLYLYITAYFDPSCNTSYTCSLYWYLLAISSKVVLMRWCVRVRVCTLVLMRWCRYAGTTNAPCCFLLDGHFKARLHLHAREPDCCCSYSQLIQRRFSTAGHSCELSNYSKICKYF